MYEKFLVMRVDALVIDGGRVPVDICVYFFKFFQEELTELTRS